jgi:hypothetical protein
LRRLHPSQRPPCPACPAQEETRLFNLLP